MSNPTQRGTMSTTTSKPLSADFWVGLLSPAFLAAWLIPAILFRSWVLTALWGWYIVPAFGLPSLRMVIAFGISVMVASFIPSKTKEKRTMGQLIAASFVNPAGSLLFGWVGSFFV